MNKILCSFCFISCIALSGIQALTENAPSTTYDVVIYGGTSVGVIAAVQASSMGKSVALISPKMHLGGMTSNGLSSVDIKYPDAIGGLTRNFFSTIWNYYQNDSSWVWEKQRSLKSQSGLQTPDDRLMWTLEPHVAEQLFNAILLQTPTNIFRGERLNRKDGVLKEECRIVQIEMESGMTFSGKMFIDATYEGDLMAAAQISYIVGREPNSRYNETLNGIYPNPVKIRASAQIDPYVIRGNPDSGLLPRIYPNVDQEKGNGDNQIGAYNYRMCLTNIPENRVQIEQPKDYDEEQYEIVFRAIEAGRSKKNFFKLTHIPNGKTDSNNASSISTDFIGMSWDYPEADYAEREKIALGHEKWQRGLIWTLQNHPRVPEAVKSYYITWGLPKDEFPDNNNWPYELYVREARRMISPYVIDEHVATGKVPVEESVGLASYNIDSHAVKYVVNSKGFLGTEGGIVKVIPGPYPVSYRAIIPSRNECENLLVPICLSASHAAYGSVRMEPTFMILGQSAATAACLAIDQNVALQDLSYDILSNQLITDGQILK